MSIDKTSHLGGTEDEIKLTDFELQIWQMFHGFAEWQEACEKVTNLDELSADEIGVLHVVRFKDRPKTVVEIGQSLNRNNFFSINYNINKLKKMGLIKRVGVATSKQHHYTVTEKGKQNTERYNQARRSLLIKELNKELKQIDFDTLIGSLAKLRMVYAEATKNTTLYQHPDDSKEK